MTNCFMRPSILQQYTMSLWCELYHELTSLSYSTCLHELEELVFDQIQPLTHGGGGVNYQHNLRREERGGEGGREEGGGRGGRKKEREGGRRGEEREGGRREEEGEGGRRRGKEGGGVCVVLLFQRGSVAPTLSSRIVPNSSLLPLLSQAILSLHSLTTLFTLPQYTSHSRSLSCTCTTVPSGCLRGGVCEEGGGHV